MATRCLIAAQFDPEVVDSDEIVVSYCHFDGYPQGVGRMLHEQYRGDAAYAVADHGAMSTLKEFELFSTVDRLDDGDSFIVGDEQELIEEAETIWAEYVYLWKNGDWYCAEMHGEKNFEPLDSYFVAVADEA